MSLITCCPTCLTMFQVETDALKVSDGWVRCGHCDGVFDASAHFQSLPPDPAPAPFKAATAEPQAAFEPAPAQGVTAEAPAAGAALSSYLSAPEVQDTPASLAPATNPSDSDARLALYGREPKGPSKADLAARRKTEVSFVQTARQRSRRSQPLYRALAVTLSLALLTALLVLGLVYERVELASRYPALLPTLQSLCKPLNCQIDPPRVIEAIEIDSSSFTQTGPDTFRIHVVLKNSRLGAVAMPALEVSLTGAGDKVLFSKTVAPAEFGASSVWLHKAQPFAGAFDLRAAWPAAARVGIAPGETASAETASILEPAAPPAITGYRLLAFYP